MTAAKSTTSHEVIRRWVEKHGGHPATVKRTRSRDDVGLLRIDFPGFSGEGTLQPISWDQWFEKFDEQNLAFLYQDGKNTTFNKLVRRDPEEVRSSDRSRGTSRTASGRRAAASALGAERRRLAGSRRGRTAQNGTAQRPPKGRSPDRGGARRTRAVAAQADRSSMTKAELYEQARSANVAHRSTMNKQELIRALERMHN